MHLLFYTCINISEIKMDTSINDKSSWCSHQLASLRTTISTSQSSSVFFRTFHQMFVRLIPQVASLMMEFHQVWHSIRWLKCHRYWSSTRKGVISGMPPERNPSVSLRHWCPKNPCPTVQQVWHHQTITYQYMNKTINITFLSWTRGWVCKFKPSSNHVKHSYKSGWIPYLIRAFGNPNHKFFRSGQVFGVERGLFDDHVLYHHAQGFVQVTRRNADVEIPTSRAVATSQRPSSQVPCWLHHCRHWRWTSRNHHRSPRELQQSWGIQPKHIDKPEIIVVGLRRHAWLFSLKPGM